MSDFLSQNDINSTVMRPRSVALAERLLWLSAGICVLFAVLEMTRFLPVGIHGDAVTSNFISGAFLAFCAVKIGDGRNWARWLLLVLFVMGSFILPLALIFAPEVLRSMSAVVLVVAFVQFAIQLSALILAFTPASNAWFRPAASKDR